MIRLTGIGLFLAIAAGGCGRAASELDAGPDVIVPGRGLPREDVLAVGGAPDGGVTDGGCVSHQTDEFLGHQAAVDVLWVVDTDDDGVAQQQVAAALPSILDPLLQDGVDFQMAVTSTDVYSSASSEQGALEPCPHCKILGTEPRIVSSKEGPGAADSLARLLNLGGGALCYQDCNGFAIDEMFFEAAYEALLQTAPGGYNQPFYRPDALLAVILLNGDSEDDRSDTQSLNAYYNAFIGLKGASNFSLSYVNSSGPGNQKIDEMVRLTQGVEADLSHTGSPSWIDELNTLWPTLTSQVLEYPLSATPLMDPLAITVTYDGTPIPSVDNGVVQWTYDPARNAVAFVWQSRPLAGDKVEIQYTVPCTH